MTSYEAKCEELRAELSAAGQLAVAYSGGVDSGVLLHAAREVLGARAHAVIADSPSLARAELAAALAFARSIGVEPVVLATRELDDPRYRANAGDRCYFCKSALFDELAGWAREHSVAQLAFGEIADDLLDVRPGRAAARERGVLAPLADAGFTKADVRRYAREHALAVADKPASPCLASRLPVGTVVTRERLARIERAEALLREQGLREFRVRDHAPLARIEAAEGELALARNAVDASRASLSALGFTDLELTRYVAPADRRAARAAPPTSGSRERIGP